MPIDHEFSKKSKNFQHLGNRSVAFCSLIAFNLSFDFHILRKCRRKVFWFFSKIVRKQGERRNKREPIISIAKSNCLFYEKSSPIDPKSSKKNKKFEQFRNKKQAISTQNYPILPLPINLRSRTIDPSTLVNISHRSVSKFIISIFILNFWLNLSSARHFFIYYFNIRILKFVNMNFWNLSLNAFPSLV